MATINNFEDLSIWKKAQDLAVIFYKLCDANEKIAKGSCGEVRNCLLLSIKVNYTILTKVTSIIACTVALGKQIGALMI